MKGWFARPVSSVAGALAGAGIVALLEALKTAREWRAPLGNVAAGDVAVLVPIATAAGLAVAAFAMVLDPGRRWTAHEVVARARAWSTEVRARWAAAALLAPPAALGAIVVSAQLARGLLAHGGGAWSVGPAMALASTAALALAAAAVAAAVPPAARVFRDSVGPLAAGFCGTSFALACACVGVRLGNASGDGPTPLAILGVLARRELDVSPVVLLAAIALCALLGERASRAGRWGRVVVALGLVAAAWAIVVQQATALDEDPQTAHAIQLGAPLGRIGLALARRATDRDHDGASAYFGGGDCDDRDPRRNPDAVDIPGNGIDEDCSGADLEPARPVVAARAASARPAVPRDLNLVLVTIDTLRIDLGFMGYPRPVSPNLDRLASRSTVFERAYAMASYTGKSVGPTMIGRYPSETFRDGAHFDTYFPENTFLAERLRDAGFRTMGAASYWYFKPKYGLSQGMDMWDLSAMPPDSAADVDSSVTSDKLADVAIRLLSDPSNVSGRFFLWVHFFDPHAQYVPHPEAPSFAAGAKGWAKPLYDGEVWFTDHHLGRLLDFIASRPWGARTAIVVTADHGEAFDEHGMNWHGVDLWEPIVRVPLVVYVPGVRPHRVKARRSLVDLVPTLLDLLGVPQPPPGELSGDSTVGAIVSPEANVDERDVFMDMPAGPQVSQHRAIIHGTTPGLKLMHEGGPVFLLFDLSRDPGELEDLSRDRAALARMKEVYEDKLSSLHEIHVDPAPYESR